MATGERAEEAGYDSTLLVVNSILDDIDRAGWIRVSGLWGPPHAPAHLAGDHTRNLPRTALPSCPSSSLQTPTKDQDQPEYDIRGDGGSANREPRTANLWLVE